MRSKSRSLTQEQGESGTHLALPKPATVAARVAQPGDHLANALWRPQTKTPLSPHIVASLQRSRGNYAVGQILQRFAAIQRQDDEEAQTGSKALASARFGGDKKLHDIFGGSKTVKKGAKGLTVTKMQQALADMGYPLPKYGVDGIFGSETKAVLMKYQHDAVLPETGEFDQITIRAMQARFATRQPYLDNASFDPANPDKGTRRLTPADKAAVEKALVPARGIGGHASTFQENIGGQLYGDEIRKKLQSIISALHKELFADKEPLRKDPASNFHDWSVLEGTADAAKDVTDAVYGSYAKGPPMRAAAGNFVDQWEDETTRNKALSPLEKQGKAREKVRYLINSNCDDVNQHHSAVPSDTKEAAILKPIIEEFVATPAKVQTLLDLDIGWEGAQLDGVVYLQRYKQNTADANRTQLWQLFHTCIHEYIHSLAHLAYQAYAQKFAAKGDQTRYNTLIEGMDDFFTENVRKTVKADTPLRKKVEGPYYDSKAAAPAVTSSTYPSKAQAEQVIAIVGIRNAAAAYFRGQVKLIGGK